MTLPISRRAALVGGGAALAAAPSAARAQLFGASQPSAAKEFRAVAVDVTPLLDHGGGTPARNLGQLMLGQMRKHFADRITGARNAPLLTARLTNMYFQIYSGVSADFALGNNDNIEGDGIVSSGGQVLSTTHVLTELPASYSGSWFTPGIDEARLVNLSYQFVYWLRREMGL